MKEKSDRIIISKVEERLEEILKTQKDSSEPIVAREFAKKYQVSRQVIVGDIARLRAAGEEIVSTPRGYLMHTTINDQMTKKIICNHNPDQTSHQINSIEHH